VADSLAIALSLDGHTVRVARDGFSAIEEVQAFVPNVVLLDVGLPGMSGYEVARRLRQSTDRGDLVLITLSGYGGEADRLRSDHAGCNSHLVKPVAYETLRTVLDRAALNGRTTHPEPAAQAFVS
jgi:two-component system CheB/CheR fusion protein